jgi:hypothetical protein
LSEAKKKKQKRWMPVCVCVSLRLCLCCNSSGGLGTFYNFYRVCGNGWVAFRGLSQMKEVPHDADDEKKGVHIK